MTLIANILITALEESTSNERVRRDGILGPATQAASSVAILNVARGMAKHGFITSDDVHRIVEAVKTP